MDSTNLLNKKDQPLNVLRLLLICFLVIIFIVGSFIFFTTIFTIISHNQSIIIDPKYGVSILNRSSFPPDFVFGSASSAYQNEGAALQDGKGPSIWDTFTHKFPEMIPDGSNGDVATDSYNRYKEDVKIMKEMGLDAYRFSISWSRLLPYGKVSKGVNKEGIKYYHNLIDELLANGIQPSITIFHWDLPQALQDEYGGFSTPYIINDFRDYAELCFKEYGNKVKYWTTLNEPHSYSTEYHSTAVYSSKQCLKSNPENCTIDFGTVPYLVAHYQLLAHAAAVRIYRQKYQASQKGVIGIVLNAVWQVPFSEAMSDQNAAERALDFLFGWYMDPITYGDYPRTMRSLVRNRLPKFSKEESEMLKGSFDFLGLNYYTSNFAADAPDFKNRTPNYNTDSLVYKTTERNGIPIGPTTAADWLYVYPRGIYDLLLYIKRRYKDPIIYITENGTDESNDATLSLEEASADSMRIQYYHDHLAFVQRAIVRDGVKVKGYFAWSLMDNFEWLYGYTVRFGIIYIDFKDGLKRYPKHSAKWFKNFLE
ncbi:beta-glucosidase 24-like [Amaranthus tricolor]|uniref:beta-glucosidase 24-like n=1 Tax=Amaranthus tricolor TaxID=29722 RepID=UPI00259090AB|nr:beta-glucosidase 24-like [Amaranthus tricolor]